MKLVLIESKRVQHESCLDNNVPDLIPPASLLCYSLLELYLAFQRFLRCPMMTSKLFELLLPQLHYFAFVLLEKGHVDLDFVDLHHHFLFYYRSG